MWENDMEVKSIEVARAVKRDAVLERWFREAHRLYAAADVPASMRAASRRAFYRHVAGIVVVALFGRAELEPGETKGRART